MVGVSLQTLMVKMPVNQEILLRVGQLFSGVLGLAKDLILRFLVVSSSATP